MPASSSARHKRNAALSFRMMPPRRLAASLGAGTLLASLASAAYSQTPLNMPAVDGKINAYAISGNTMYIGGQFTSVGGQARTGLAAINLTTNTVTNWDPYLFNSQTTASVNALSVNADGSLWVGGNFDSAKALVTDAGSARNDIALFTAAGGLSTVSVANNASLFGGISGLTQDASGNLYAVGDFNTFGNSSTGNASGFAKITASGTADNSFAPVINGGGNASSQWRDFVVSPDGSKMYMASNSFSQYAMEGGGTINQFGFVQLNTSDGLATGLDLGSDGQGFVTKIINGSLYLGGGFTTIDGQSVAKIAKFSSANGTPTLDASFGQTGSAAPNAGVRGITQIGGKLYLEGDFTTDNGVANNGLIAVNATTGALDNSFSVSASSGFGGRGSAIAGYDNGAGNAAIFVTTGSGGSADNVVVNGTTTHYYTGLTVPAGAASAPEPSAFALLASAGMVPVFGVIRRRRRVQRSANA